MLWGGWGERKRESAGQGYPAGASAEERVVSLLSGCPY